MNFNKLNFNKLIISLLLFIGVAYIYKKLKFNIDLNEKSDDIKLITDFLLNEKDDNFIKDLEINKKPILWIHINYEINSRKWKNFGSRNTSDLNQDYLYLTIQSIINSCGKSFTICLIDDNSFSKLLDNWNVDLDNLSQTHKNNVRYVGICQLLYKYGGMYLENSFIVFKDLISLYNNSCQQNKLCIGEFKSNNKNSSQLEFAPSLKLISCKKGNKEINKLYTDITKIVNIDNTKENEFIGMIENILHTMVSNNTINIIDGKFIGTRFDNNKTVNIEDLCGYSKLNFNKDIYCLYIPRDDLLKRNALNWFVYLNEKQVLESNTNIGKYLSMCLN